MDLYLRSPIVSALLLIALTAMLYSPAVRYPLVYEDNNDPGRFGRSVLENANGNPLRVVTESLFNVARAWSGNDYWADHVINIWWHLANVVLLGLLAWLVLPPWGAVAALGVFALHPVQVEAVAYVSGRADLLAASGVLLALLATSRGSLVGAVVGVAFACVSKETAIMAWAVVPLWAVITAAPFPVRRFCLIGAVLAVAAMGYLALSTRDLHATADLELIGRTAWSVVRFGALIVVPLGQSIDHDWHGAPLWLQSGSVGLLVAGAVWLAWRVQQGASWLVLALASYLVWVLPRFVVAAHEGLHEHHLVVPLIGWALCVGAWLSSSQLEHARS